MYILGISCYYHDAAAALIKDGRLIAASEEERFSRKKHDSSYPAQAIQFCLEEAGITTKDLDYVVFYEKPLKKFERILLSVLQGFPRSYGVFRESMIAWFNQKLWVRAEILTQLDIPDAKLLFVEHHLSHAASAFFCSPYDESAILTIDGVGEWTTTTVGHGRGLWQEKPADGNDNFQFFDANTIELNEEISFPHSLGLLYSAFTAFLGFRVNSGEYKVMGMAPYGRPNRVEDVHKVIKVDSDGSFRLNMEYFSFHHSAENSYSHKFLELFGPARLPESEFYTETTHPKRNLPHWNDKIAAENQHYADIAASVQFVTEEIVLKMANHAHKVTGSKNLCLAGGVALNSVANGRILRESPFENVYIQPAPGDAGGALGCALYAYHVLLGKPRTFVMDHAYWGKAYGPDRIISDIKATGRSYIHFDDVDKVAEEIVKDLVAGKVVSLAQGRFEWGPRALGNRSIIADPRSEAMKLIVNESIKFREPFRPFAPAVLESHVRDYWDGLGNVEKVMPLRFMLSVYKSLPDTYSRIPAVTHAGGSGRVQTVRRDWNPLYYRIIERFGEETGEYVILNTSFNLRGEPIVTTPANALNTFNKSDIATLCLDGFIVRK